MPRRLRPPRQPAAAAAPALTGLALTAAVLWPVLTARGYALSYDMVFVPDPPLSARVLGVDGSVPRAVPSDLVAALLSTVLPGDLVQKLLLAAVVVLAATGAGRLVLRPDGGAGPPAGAGAAAVLAAVVYVWNPYLAERLVLGHWALLLGYAALPWAVEAALRSRAAADGGPRPVAGACAWTALAGVGGGNAVAICAPVVALVLLWPRQGHVRGRGALPGMLYLAFVAVVSLPWVLPALLRPGGTASDPAGVDAFAARADGPLGVPGSLFTLGGIWNAAVVPAERGSAVLAVAAVVLVTLALAAGLPPLVRAGGAPLVTAGVAALVLPAAGAMVGGPVVRYLVQQVSGAGLLRDGQKFLAGWVLLVAVCAGYAVRRIAGVRHGHTAVVTVAGVVAVLALLPGLALGAGGRLAPVEYPPVWGQVRAALDGDPRPGAVVVLPWGPYRRFDWNAGRVVLDPAQRITARPVVQDDGLPLTSGRVAGEDARAARVAVLLRGDGDLVGPLAAAGYRYVLVHASAPGADRVVRRLDGAPCVVCDPRLSLHRLPAATGDGTAAGGGVAVDDGRDRGGGAAVRAAVVLGGHLLAVAVTMAAIAAAAGVSRPGGLRRERRRALPAGRTGC